MIDEPLIMPFAPGEAITRATQVLGAMRRVEALRALPNFVALQNARDGLLAALTEAEYSSVSGALCETQEQMLAIYEHIKGDDETREALGFPPPELSANPDAVDIVDVRTVLATYTKSGRQVLTSLSFERAANATAYWLHEIRTFGDDTPEIAEDPLIESYAPLFERLRLSVGSHTLRIKSRNPGASACSETFAVEVPEL